MTELIRIDVERFFTKYVPDPADAANLLGIDYCSYGPVGALDRSKTTERVSRLAAVQAGGDSDNLAVLMAKARWEAIRPKYEAWKEGKEIPANGTPLAAWNLLQSEDAEVLRSHRIFTVEDVAGLTDSILQKIGLPNGRSMVEQAKMFLKSADANRASAEMAAMRAEMELMREELLEAKNALMREPDDDEVVPAPPRRGRPPKAMETMADNIAKNSALVDEMRKRSEKTEQGEAA